MNSEHICPECRHTELSVESCYDGSGKVHCERPECDYTDTFAPHDDERRRSDA